jgi:hypothetical protein
VKALESINERWYNFLYKSHSGIEYRKGNLGNYLVSSVKLSAHPKASNSFFKFIKGKRIALVGPAVPLQFNGEEIDDFDVVVRLKYRGDEFIPEKNLVGEKTNVTYWGSGVVNFGNSKTHTFDNLQHLDFLVTTAYWLKVKTKKAVADLGLEFAPEIIPAANRKVKLIFGTPNTGTVALLDLLSCSPQSIKVFNFDFYTGSSDYYFDYSIGSPMQDSQGKNPLYNTAIHDQWSQIELFQHFFRCGQLRGDERCEKVLRYSLEDYFDGCSKCYVV